MDLDPVYFYLNYYSFIWIRIYRPWLHFIYLDLCKACDYTHNNVMTLSDLLGLLITHGYMGDTLL